MSKKNQPSINDVAKLAGVSLGTVSNVLNYPDRVREQTVRKVTKAIDQLGFVRNDAARQLKAGKSKALGMIVLDSSNPFFGNMAKGAEDAAAEDGYQVFLGNSGSELAREANYLRMFREHRLSGVLLSPIGGAGDLIATSRQMGTQVVLVDRKEDASLCCSVSVDDIAGGRLAAQHLIDLGRQKLAFVGGPLDIHQIADRLQGAKESVRATKGKASIKVYRAKAQDVISGREVGMSILRENKENRPDAIFAANDLLAVGLLQAFALKNSVAVPDEIAIVGYDDIDFAQSAVVPLTSIKQPASLLGSTALEMLVDEIENTATHQHRQITFQPELVTRESTGYPATD
jgi:LacI family transcriptional regulator